MNLHFGALVPKLKEQLEAQEIFIDDDEALKHLQLDADALVRCHVRGLIPDSQAHAARKKLMKKIEKAVKK